MMSDDFQRRAAAKLCAILGPQDRKFPLPGAFNGILHGSPEIEFGTEVKLLPPGLKDLASFEICRVDELSKELLLNSGRIWLRVLAWQILSGEERNFWRTAEMSDHRRVEWLIGRAAAKQAVRKLLARRYGLMLCPADIQLTSDERGRPMVVEGCIPGLLSVADISIAHTGGMAVAIAVDHQENLRVGIDMEQSRPLEAGLAGIAFGSDEESLLSGLDGAAANERMLLLWCVKEAAAKAIGLGFQGKPRSYVVSEYNPSDGTAKVRYAGAALLQAPASEPVQVVTMRENELILAVATSRKE